MNFQLHRRSVVVALPAENAGPLRIFHLHADAVIVIPEIYLDVFHPPFAVSVSAFKMLVHVDGDLVRVRAGNVNCSFIVVDGQRAAGRNGESFLEVC